MTKKKYQQLKTLIRKAISEAEDEALEGGSFLTEQEKEKIRRFVLRKTGFTLKEFKEHEKETKQQLKGEEGKRGERGEKGDKGDSGKDGAEGKIGQKGDTGNKGEKGDKGDTGEVDYSRLNFIQNKTEKEIERAEDLIKNQTLEKHQKSPLYNKLYKLVSGKDADDLHKHPQIEKKLINKINSLPQATSRGNFRWWDGRYYTKEEVDKKISSEDFWKRSGTTIEPETANDSLDMGSGTGTFGTITDETASLTGGSLTSVKLGSLTSNGFVKTSGGDGTLSVDTNTYLTGITGESIADLSDVGSVGSYTAGYVLRADGTDIDLAELQHSDLGGVGTSDHHTKYALTDDLAAGEITQLQAINSVTISNTQWGYLGAMSGQPLESESDTLDDVLGRGDTSASNNLTLTNGTLTAGNVEASTINATTETDLFQADGSSLIHIDSTNDNLVIGLGAVTQANLTGERSTFIGDGAGGGGQEITGEQNTVIGVTAGENLTTSKWNMLMGLSAGRNLTTGEENTFIGRAAGSRIKDGSFNMGIGTKAIWGTTDDSSANNVAIGAYTLGGGTINGAIRNIAIGSYAGNGVTSGDLNTFIGYQAGITTTTGRGNLLIGYRAYASGANADYELNIGDLIKGDLDSGKVGIGTTPSVALDVAGAGKFTDDIKIDADSKKLLLGAGQDAGLWYDGSNLHIDAQQVGSGNIILDNLPTSDPTVAGAVWNDTGTLKVSSG